VNSYTNRKHSKNSNKNKLTSGSGGLLKLIAATARSAVYLFLFWRGVLCFGFRDLSFVFVESKFGGETHGK